METAILLYQGMTALDAIGPYEVLRCVPDNHVRLVSQVVGPIRTDAGLTMLNAEYSLDQVTAPDIVVVPGASNIRPLLENATVLNWLKGVHLNSRWTTSVCSGALLLGKVGLLNGQRATTHWLALDALKLFGATPIRERVVREGKIITAAGVSAGIDMALTLVALEFGPNLAQAIQLAIEYDPQPPFQAGNPTQVEPNILQTARQILSLPVR